MNNEINNKILRNFEFMDLLEIEQLANSKPTNPLDQHIQQMALEYMQPFFDELEEN